MSRKEARFARKVVDDAVYDAASKIAARMPMKKKTAASTGTTAKTAPTPKRRKSGGNPGASTRGGEAS
jgi:hypothetical protein